jgi:flavin-dependent dehydrogenase
VVGASAAGLFAACLLAKRGTPVEVLERSETLNPEARTLIVTSRMRGLLGEMADGCTVNQIRRFELFTDGRSAQVSLDSPDLVIERSLLIRSLAAHAQKAGVTVSLGKRFRGLAPTQNGLRVEVEECDTGAIEETHADAVVGSDGVASRVARAAGWPQQRTVPLIQALVPLPKDMPSDAVRVWFIPQDTPYFYWLIPESESRGALGLIGEDGPQARGCLEAFMTQRGFEPLSFQAARIPMYTQWIPVERRVGKGRVFLVGDAAGQVKVTTVGGIVTGFRGAIGVAEAILHGRSRELRTLRRELDLHLLLRKALHHFTQADYSRLVDLLNAPARRSLSRYSRDEAFRVLWHICLNQPRLLLLGLRGLLTGGRLTSGPGE